ncbi:MAG: small multi-drug export protein [Candidatus Omnitrophica bacterium]|nr:small multi-drug export protein [Candidatus Omnitrophota bacterium]
MDEIVQSLVNHIQFSSKELSLIVLSALPITELRGAIPLGVLLFKLHPIKTYFLCCLGNTLPIFPLLMFFGKVEQLLKRYEFSNTFLQWYLAKVKKQTKVIERFELWGLMLFVAIPLPITGAWTGSVAAFILGIDRKKSFISITCGVFIAGVIVTLLTLGGHTFYSFL